MSTTISIPDRPDTSIAVWRDDAPDPRHDEVAGVRSLCSCGDYGLVRGNRDHLAARIVALGPERVREPCHVCVPVFNIYGHLPNQGLGRVPALDILGVRDTYRLAILPAFKVQFPA